MKIALFSLLTLFVLLAIAAPLPRFAPPGGAAPPGREAVAPSPATPLPAASKATVTEKPLASPPPVTLSPVTTAALAGRRIHPAIRFLDAAGKPVLETHEALSPMKTCGQCHETAYIAAHSYHAQVGRGEPPAGGHPWDQGPGLLGRWNPLLYRSLSPRGDPRPDLGLADWVRLFGVRHVGGGPAETGVGPGTTSLTGGTTGPNFDPNTMVVDPATGVAQPWNWDASGTVEMNCFLCHLPAPDNAQRVATLREGRFRWASTAVLAGTGLVSRSDAGWQWNPSAFDASGAPDPQRLRISLPSSANCRQCHGQACRCTDPVLFANSLANWDTETTGNVFAPELIAYSAMNLQAKETLTRPWDVHADRLLQCRNCHGAPNNPATIRKEGDSDKPAHLEFDSRRADLNDFLIRPNHNFTTGHTAQGTVARRLDGTMRDCRQCHDAERIHDFLPYRKLHFEKLACQSCHIPRVYAPTRQVTDWTVLTADGSPRVEHRGVDGPVNDPASLITGFTPVFCLHREAGGAERLAPHNLIVSWYWVGGRPERPVRLNDMKAAWFSGAGVYHPDILTALDRNHDGRLNATELRLDTPAKVQAVSARLAAVGVANPRICGEIQPYTLSHGVASGQWATRQCTVCHGAKSIVDADFQLASFVPGEVVPHFVGDARVDGRGAFYRTAGGGLGWRPNTRPARLYVHGTDRFRWLDAIGLGTVLLAILGSAVHGVLRIAARRRRRAARLGPGGKHA